MTVFSLTSFAFFYRVSCFGIMDGSEAYYPAAVREMIECNNYLVPQLNYQIYFSKPIMTFWLIASAYHMFGINEFASRFWSCVFCIVVATFTAYTGATIRGARVGLLAGLIIAACPAYLAYLRVSSVDAFFSSFLSISFLSLLMVVFGNRKYFWPLIYIGLAGAVLTKGPAGLVLAFAGAGLAAVLSFRSWKSFWPAFKSIQPVWGVLLWAGLTLPWFYAVSQATDGLFIKGFLGYENIGRASGHTNLNPSYWFKYPLEMLATFFPWILFLPAFLAVSFREIRSGASWADDANISTIGLNPKTICLGFASAVYILFSISKTQMETYIIPSFVPFAMYFALHISDYLDKFESNPAMCSDLSKRWTNAVSIIALVFGIVAFGAGVASHCFLKGATIWMCVVLALAGLILSTGMFLLRRNYKQGQLWTGISTCLVLQAVATGLMVNTGNEYIYAKITGPLHELCKLIADKPAQVGYYTDCRLSLMYYLKRPVYCFYQAERVVPVAAFNAPLSEDAKNFPLYILSKVSNAKQLVAHGIELKEEAVKGDWGLYLAPGRRIEPYETIEATFAKQSWDQLMHSNFNTGPLTIPLSGGTRYKHNELDPFSYR